MNNPCFPSPACAPTFEHNPVKRVLGAKNSRVLIECRPKAAPKPTLSWSKGTELLFNSSRLEQPINMTIHFIYYDIFFYFWLATLSLSSILHDYVVRLEEGIMADFSASL